VEDNGGELAQCLETRCEQLDGLLQERGEGICPLEAIHDQVSSVVPSGVEGASAVDGCTRSLGGIEAPGTLVGTRFPSVNVPVCVYTSVAKSVLQRTHSGSARACVRATLCAKETACVDEALCVKETPCVEATPCVSGVVASVPGCVLPSTPCVTEAPCVDEAPCMEETTCVSGTTCAREVARVSEQPCVSEARCVRGTACVREMTVGMPEHATACPSVMTWCVSRSCIGNRAGFARRRARGSGRAAHEAATCVLAGVRPGLETPAVNVADPATDKR